MEYRGIAVSYWVPVSQVIAVLRRSFDRLFAGVLVAFRSMIH